MVKFISYKNEQIPISISFYALERLEDEGLDLEKDGLKAISRLFWFALVAGHFHQGQELKIKEDEAPLILDFCFQEFQELIPLFLQELSPEKKKKAK